MGVEFDVSGVRALAADLGDVPDRVMRMGKAAVDKTAADVETDGKAGVPPRVDTGNMRSSISRTSASRSGGTMEAEVGPTAGYSIYQHEGTSTIAPHPFMWRALERNAPGFIAAIEQLSGDALR